MMLTKKDIYRRYIQPKHYSWHKLMLLSTIVLILSLMVMYILTHQRVQHKIEKRCPNAPLVILDNDNYDPDWLPTLVTAIGMDLTCKINLIGVMVNGTDIHGKSGLMYNTVLTYYGINQRVPIGINHNLPMRTTPTRATATNPHLDPRYNGTHKDITEFPSDGLLDSQRADVTDLLCEILNSAPEKVEYITGGHLQNIQSLLMETKKCNGKELIKEKVKRFVFSTGWSIETQGKPEMNFSEGAYTTTPASIAANYVFNNMTSEVSLEFPEEGIYVTKWPHTGDQYINKVHIDSPMAFIFAVPAYGTFGTNSAGDIGALVYVGFGEYMFGTKIFENKRKTCFEINPKNATITLGNCDKNHWISTAVMPEYFNSMQAYVDKLVEMPKPNALQK